MYIIFNNVFLEKSGYLGAVTAAVPLYNVNFYYAKCSMQFADISPIVGDHINSI